MPTTPSTINYYVAVDGTLRDGSAGSIAQTPRIYYGTEYAVTLSFPASTIAEGDQLQVAVNRTRTFFSSASATGDAPVAAVAKHEVTAEEADAQAVTLTLSTNTRAMIDQVNGIDHPVRGFFGVHLLRGQSFISLAVADAFMLSVESGPDAISPSLPVVDYPTREEAEALTDRSEAAAERAEQAAAGIVPPLQLDSPPTTLTSGSVGQLATWHDPNAADQSKADHIYHLVFISTSDSATLYHWEECVLVSMGNVAGGYPVLDENGKVASAQLPPFNDAPEPIIGTTAPTTSTVGVIGQLYVNTVTSKTYHCTAITNTGTESEPVLSYTWTDDINANGGRFNVDAVVETKSGAYSVIITKATLNLGYNNKIAGLPCLGLGSNISATNAHGCCLIGSGLVSGGVNNQLVLGTWNKAYNGARVAGHGTSTSNRKNIEELSWNGDLYIAGGHQQGITVIPAATTAYTLAEGVQSHTPEAASVYTLPAVTDATRTHECILSIKFSASVLTYEFQDSAGTTLVPLPLNGDIEAGSVVSFLCRYESLLSQWVIMPVMVGKEAQA